MGTPPRRPSKPRPPCNAASSKCRNAKFRRCRWIIGLISTYIFDDARYCFRFHMLRESDSQRARPGMKPCRQRSARARFEQGRRLPRRIFATPSCRASARPLPRHDMGHRLMRDIGISFLKRPTKRPFRASCRCRISRFHHFRQASISQVFTLRLADKIERAGSLILLAQYLRRSSQRAQEK